MGEYSLPNWDGFLKPKQAYKLLNHLAQKLDPDYSAYVTRRIDADCSNYIHRIDFDAENIPDLSELKESALKIAESLHWSVFNLWEREALPDEHQLLSFAAMLERKQAVYETLKRKQGGQQKQHRDELISRIYSYYPNGSAKKTRGSHFEQTIEMVIGFLEPPPKDIHKTILNAMK
jgi:hypothetical protein